MNDASKANAWRAWQIPFEDVVSQHSSMVYSIAFHFLRDSGLAEDIAQEAFIRLSSNLRTIKSETHLALWLRRATVRLCIDELRKNRKRFTSLELVEEPSADQVDEDFLANERIRSMIAELPEKSRMALILRFQEDLSPSEIAHALSESINTVKSRRKRALATLRQTLSPASTSECE
jgi:RNA polymerase sigma-70 factor (ECF subfamily)